MLILLHEETSAASDVAGDALEQLGHAIVSAPCDVAQLEAETLRLSPDAIIVITRSPGDDLLEALRAITHSTPRPIVIFSDDPDRERIIAAVRAGASAYVVGPLTRVRLTPVLDAAIARFEQLQAARAEADAARAQLNERKLVERAKGILMKSRKLSEDDAYRAMRKQAMDRKLKLTEVARQIIAVADLLG